MEPNGARCSIPLWSYEAANTIPPGSATYRLLLALFSTTRSITLTMPTDMGTLRGMRPVSIELNCSSIFTPQCSMTRELRCVIPSATRYFRGKFIASYTKRMDVVRLQSISWLESLLFGLQCFVTVSAVLRSRSSGRSVNTRRVDI